MSALPPKADIERPDWHVRFVPCVDGSELAKLFFTFAGWSVQPCVRPVRAAHKAAGHNAFRGSGPGQNRAFEMHWHKWVVLIADRPALHYVLFALPTFTSRPMSARSQSRRKCDGFLIAITPGHHLRISPPAARTGSPNMQSSIWRGRRTRTS